MKRDHVTIIMLTRIIMVVFAAVICCGGCDARELSATSIVLGVGLDEDAGLVRVTVELSGADSSAAAVLSAAGANMTACVDALQRQIDEDLYWGSTAVLIYGDCIDRLAADSCGIYCYRELGISGKTPILRVVDRTARDVLAGTFGQAPYVALGLCEALRLKNVANQAELTLGEQLETAYAHSRPCETAAVTVGANNMVCLVDKPQ